MNSFVDQGLWIPHATLTEQNLDDQSDRVFIITGGYAGIGLELSKILYRHNGTVYIAGRSKAKADNAIAAIRAAVPESESSSGKLHFLQLDLADLPAVAAAGVEFAARESRLDVLVNNAGVMVPPAGTKTNQGFELQVGTNCVGPYLFTKTLLPLLRKTAQASAPGAVRVAWAGSMATELVAPRDGGVSFGVDGNPVVHADQWANYGQSKVGNVFLATELAKRYREDGIVSVSFNPGNLRTELQRNMSLVERILIWTVCYPTYKGAYTELYSGWSKDITLEKSGSYIIPWGRIGYLRADVDSGNKRTAEGGTGLAERFWDWCEAQVARHV